MWLSLLVRAENEPAHFYASLEVFSAHIKLPRWLWCFAQGLCGECPRCNLLASACCEGAGKSEDKEKLCTSQTGNETTETPQVVERTGKANWTTVHFAENNLFTVWEACGWEHSLQQGSSTFACKHWCCSCEQENTEWTSQWSGNKTVGAMHFLFVFFHLFCSANFLWMKDSKVKWFPRVASLALLTPNLPLQWSDVIIHKRTCMRPQHLGSPNGHVDWQLVLGTVLQWPWDRMVRTHWFLSSLRVYTDNSQCCHSRHIPWDIAPVWECKMKSETVCIVKNGLQLHHVCAFFSTHDQILCATCSKMLHQSNIRLTLAFLSETVEYSTDAPCSWV